MLYLLVTKLPYVLRSTANLNKQQKLPCPDYFFQRGFPQPGRGQDPAATTKASIHISAPSPPPFYFALSVPCSATSQPNSTPRLPAPSVLLGQCWLRREREPPSPPRICPPKERLFYFLRSFSTRPFHLASLTVFLSSVYNIVSNAPLTDG